MSGTDVLGWLKRLLTHPTPILPDHKFLIPPDHGFLDTYPAELRRIKRRRRRCSLVGHMWEVETYDSPTHTFHLKCFRCFPHIDSRQAIVSYAPFRQPNTVERKTD